MANSGGTPATAGPVSQGMSGTPATSGPVSQGMAGTPATAGPVSTTGGAVATGQGTGPGGNAGAGASMVGPEGQFAQAPPSSQIKLGPDGEPEPVGTPAQRLIGAAVAATFDKKVATSLKNMEAAPAQKPQQTPQKGSLSPEQMSEALRTEQDAVNAKYQEISQAGQTQSTPGPTPAQQNVASVQNFQVQGQGTSQQPNS